MARIPFITANDVPADERQAFDSFIQKRGGMPGSGSYALLLHMPELAQKVETLRLCLRDEASVPQPRAIGVHGDVIDSIREKRALSAPDPVEQAAVDFTQELLRGRKVSRAMFDIATARFGQRGTLALTNLIACYATLACNMNAYELEAPTHAQEKALPV